MNCRKTAAAGFFDFVGEPTGGSFRGSCVVFGGQNVWIGESIQCLEDVLTRPLVSNGTRTGISSILNENCGRR